MNIPIASHGLSSFFHTDYHRSAVELGVLFETHQNQLNPFFWWLNHMTSTMFVAQKNHAKIRQILCPFLGPVSPRISRSPGLATPPVNSSGGPTSWSWSGKWSWSQCSMDSISAPSTNCPMVNWCQLSQIGRNLSWNWRMNNRHPCDGNEFCCPKNVWKKRPISLCHPFWDSGCNML